MSGKISRRRLIRTGIGAAVGAGALGATVKVADRYGLIPANCRGVYGLSETITYAGQRLLTKLPSMAREFDRSQITENPLVNGRAPATEAYQALLASGFADWRLTVDGMVARPGTFSLAELKSFPSRSQITHQACEEGWSFIAEWTGVPLSVVLEKAGIQPQARWVFFFTFDKWWDSIDMHDALHPQTLLAYAMNDDRLDWHHGSPLRLAIPVKYGIKNIKRVATIRYTNDRPADFWAERGYDWYAGH